MTKLLISTPAQNGLVTGTYAISLAETYALLLASGITCVLSIRPSGSLLMSARNGILADFLRMDFTHILCVDADIAWNPQDILRMLGYDQDFVAACYVARGANHFCFRPELDPNGNFVETAQGLLEMQTIPAGFMLLSRKMIQSMCDQNPNLYYKPKNQGPKCSGEIIRQGVQ
jgi:hypothetical protein